MTSRPATAAPESTQPRETTWLPSERTVTPGTVAAEETCCWTPKPTIVWMDFDTELKHAGCLRPCPSWMSCRRRRVSRRAVDDLRGIAVKGRVRRRVAGAHVLEGAGEDDGVRGFGVGKHVLGAAGHDDATVGPGVADVRCLDTRSRKHTLLPPDRKAPEAKPSLWTSCRASNQLTESPKSEPAWSRHGETTILESRRRVCAVGVCTCLQGWDAMSAPRVPEQRQGSGIFSLQGSCIRRRHGNHGL